MTLFVWGLVCLSFLLLFFILGGVEKPRVSLKHWLSWKSVDQAVLKLTDPPASALNITTNLFDRETEICVLMSFL